MIRLLLLILPWPDLVMTSSPFTEAIWHNANRISATNICQHIEMPDVGLTVHCSKLDLLQVPVGISNLTVHLFLDHNLINFLRTNSFPGLYLLNMLNLSHNQLSSLEAGCFRGLAASLRFLDLSSNRLFTLDPVALGGLQARTNFSDNPWHCDCRMQLLTPQLDLDPTSLSSIICETSDLPNRGAVGISLVQLVEDWDLCLAVRRTTDVVMLITMFLWVSMLICYLVSYVRQNRLDARRHLEYIKAAQDCQL